MQHASRAVHRCADVLVAFGKKISHTPGRTCLFVRTLSTKGDSVANECPAHGALPPALATCTLRPPWPRGGREVSHDRRVVHGGEHNARGCMHVAVAQWLSGASTVVNGHRRPLWGCTCMYGMCAQAADAMATHGTTQTHGATGHIRYHSNHAWSHHHRCLGADARSASTTMLAPTPPHNRVYMVPHTGPTAGH